MLALEDETTIGDYTKIGHVSDATRQQLVGMIQGIHTVKKYRAETFYQALSLADRYLVISTVTAKPVPALELLACTCMLMAAKLEQPKVPSQSKMIKIAEVNWGAQITKAMLVAQERDIIETLDFDLRNTSPLVCLGRFLRLFDLDLVEQCPRSLETS